MVALATGRGGDAGEVGAGARLGHGDGQHHPAGGDLGQPARLLIVAGQVQQVGQADFGVHPHRAEVDVGGHRLLDEGGVEEVAVLAGAAEPLRDLHADEAVLGGLAVDLLVRGPGPLPVAVVRGDLPGDEGPDGAAEGLVVLAVNGAAHDDPAQPAVTGSATRPASRAEMMSLASATTRSTSSRTVGTSWMRPCTWPTLQMPASRSPSS